MNNLNDEDTNRLVMLSSFIATSVEQARNALEAHDIASANHLLSVARDAMNDIAKLYGVENA